MSKGIPIKDALKKWEAENEMKASEATAIKLNGHHPPIDKLDASMSTLANCEKLSLSTNGIDKMTNLQGLTKLKVFSIGRNLVKNLAGIEVLGETLEELWASYNAIEKLKPISALKKLKVLYLSNNNIKDPNELKNMAELQLMELLLTGNPIEATLGDDYRDKVAQLLPLAKKLDGVMLSAEEEEG